MQPAMNHGVLMELICQSLHVKQKNCISSIKSFTKWSWFITLLIILNTSGYEKNCIYSKFILNTWLLCSSQCELIMNVLWTRLAETGANWRHVYKVRLLENWKSTTTMLLIKVSTSFFHLILLMKTVLQALTIIEYLLANGSERAVDEIIEHSFKIAVWFIF